MIECVVYWIFDETCVDIQNSGYVGVSKDAASRFKAHIKNCRVPSDSQYIVIFEGLRKDCFAHEFQLRPTSGIGWNRAVGGAQGWRIGFSHSKHTKVKMSAAALGRKQLPEHVSKRIAAVIGKKRPKQSKSMSGSRNPMFGTKRPEHVINAMRLGRLNKSTWNRQEIYCVGCHERTNITCLVKYHNKCFKKFCMTHCH